MDFVAQAAFDSLLAVRGIEGAETVEFRVYFKILRQVMAHNYAGEPSIGSGVNVVVANFPIEVDGAELF